MWKNTVQPGRPQITIRCMRNACWMTQATNTHSEYVKPIAFPLQQWLHERGPMLRLYANCLSSQYLDYPRNFVKWFLFFGFYDQNSVHMFLLRVLRPKFGTHVSSSGFTTKIRYTCLFSGDYDQNSVHTSLLRVLRPKFGTHVSSSGFTTKIRYTCLFFGFYDQNSVHVSLLCHACPNFTPSWSLITSHLSTTLSEVPECDISSSLALFTVHSSYIPCSVPWRPVCHPNYRYAPHNDVSVNDGPHIWR